MGIPAPSPDTTAVVTGASSGIGTELARELARRGHGVTLVARREERLRAIADQLAAEHNVRAEVLAADLSDEASRTRIGPALEARGLTVSTLVNNAGLSTTGAVHRATPERDLAMIRTDVEAIVHLCSMFIPRMVERGSGAVLNVASTAAFQPLPGQAGYGGAKAFVLSYSRATRAELRGTGVTVTVLCPGPVQTEFAVSAGFDEEEANNSLPKIMWLSAEKVAKTAIRGLDKDKAVVIPGTANRVGAAFAHLTPRRVLLPILARQHPALKES